MPSDGKCYRFRTKPFFPYVCERIRAVFASLASSAGRYNRKREVLGKQLTESR